MEANLAWADCTKVVTGYAGRLVTTPLGVEASIGRELFFMTILMLHAYVLPRLITTISDSSMMIQCKRSSPSSLRHA